MEAEGMSNVPLRGFAKRRAGSGVRFVWRAITMSRKENAVRG